MKQLLFFISAIVLLAACGNKTGKVAEVAPADSDSTVAQVVEKPQIPALKTDSFGMSKSDEKAEVSVEVDWPVEGDSALVLAVRKYICDDLKVKLSTDGKSVVKKAFKSYYSATVGQWEELYMSNDDDDSEDADAGDDEDDEPVKGPPFSNAISFKKVADTDKYVSFIVETYGYYGGAHGMSSRAGVTFSKATAKTIGYVQQYNDKTNTFSIRKQTLFNEKVKSKDFNALLKSGLKEYFAEVTGNGKKRLSDSELAEMLMGEKVSNLPLPGNPPHFTKDGLEFIYQQYEIAAYCYGMPTFTIPYESIMPFLTPEGVELAK